MNSVVLVKASWCPVCPQAEALWKSLAESHSFDYREVDIASDEGKDLVAKYSIMSVPTTIIDDKVAFLGVPDKKEAIDLISST